MLFECLYSRLYSHKKISTVSSNKNIKKWREKLFIFTFNSINYRKLIDETRSLPFYFFIILNWNSHFFITWYSSSLILKTNWLFKLYIWYLVKLVDFANLIYIFHANKAAHISHDEEMIGKEKLRRKKYIIKERVLSFYVTV